MFFRLRQNFNYLYLEKHIPKWNTQANTLPTLQVLLNFKKTEKNSNIFVSFNNGHGVDNRFRLQIQIQKLDQIVMFSKLSLNRNILVISFDF